VYVCKSDDDCLTFYCTAIQKKLNLWTHLDPTAADVENFSFIINKTTSQCISESNIILFGLEN